MIIHLRAFTRLIRPQLGLHTMHVHTRFDSPMVCCRESEVQGLLPERVGGRWVYLESVELSSSLCPGSAPSPQARNSLGLCTQSRPVTHTPTERAWDVPPPPVQKPLLPGCRERPLHPEQVFNLNVISSDVYGHRVITRTFSVPGFFFLAPPTH